MFPQKSINIKFDLTGDSSWLVQMEGYRIEQYILVGEQYLFQK